MQRRHFLKSLGAAAISGAFPACGTSQKPNIVFILIDDLGWPQLGCYGSRFQETPNIDRLASQGMQFTNAYAACTVCSPTRASVLTGKYPARLHITNWIPGHKRPYAKLQMPEILNQLPHEQVTLAEALRPAGYVSAGIGKWHLGGEDFYPESQGFDLNIGGTHKGAPPSYFSPYRIPTLKDGPEGEYLTDRLADEAVNFIDQYKNQPFFLYWSHFAVHTPIQGKQALTDHFEKRRQPSFRQSNAEYAAMIKSVDESVGKLVKHLKDLNIYEKTLFIFMSDNGGLVRIENNLPLRAGKGSPYEGGHRIPMFMVLPGTIPAGAENDTPVISNDIFPTLLDIAGFKSIPKNDGLSLKPVVTESGTINRDALFWHYPHYHPGGATPYSAIRKNDFKLIEFFEDGRLELYDLKNDRAEKRNLAEQMLEKAVELREELDTWRQEVGAAYPSPNPDYDLDRAHWWHANRP